MNLKEIEKTISESMVLTDSPSEPMLVRFVVKTNPKAFSAVFDSSIRSRFTEELFRTYPELGVRFEMNASEVKSKWSEDLDIASVASVVWERQDKAGRRVSVCAY